MGARPVVTEFALQVRGGEGWLCKTQWPADWSQLAIHTAPRQHRNFRRRACQRMRLISGSPQPSLVEIQIVPKRVNLVQVSLIHLVIRELPEVLSKVGLTINVKILIILSIQIPADGKS